MVELIICFFSLVGSPTNVTHICLSLLILPFFPGPCSYITSLIKSSLLSLSSLLSSLIFLDLKLLVMMLKLSNDDVLLNFLLDFKVPLKLFELANSLLVLLFPKINKSYKAEFLYIFIFEVANIFLIFLDCSIDISSNIGEIKYFINSLYFSSSLCFKNNRPYPIKSYSFACINS